MRNVLTKGELSEQIGKLNEAEQYLLLMYAEQKRLGNFALSIALESIANTVKDIKHFLGE